MKNKILFLLISIFLISSIFAIYTNDSNNNETEKPSITMAPDSMNKAKDAIQENINETKKQIKKGIEDAKEYTEGILQKNKNQIRERVKEALQEKNHLNLAIQQRLQEKNYSCPDNCSCQGSTIKCETKKGRQMTVMAGNSGNMIVQTKNKNGDTANFSTKTDVQLYHHNGSMYGKFKGNMTKEINITPDQVHQRIRKNLKLKTENKSRINLTENGTYEIQTRKHSRLFGFIPVKEKLDIKMNPENGQIIEKKERSWWGFLARDVKEK